MLEPERVNVPVEVFVRLAEPAIGPEMVNVSELSTCTVEREQDPAPPSVRVVPLEPITVPPRVVVKLVSVLIDDEVCTFTVPELVTFPEQWREPPFSVREVAAPPMLFAELIESVPPLTTVPPE